MNIIYLVSVGEDTKDRKETNPYWDMFIQPIFIVGLVSLLSGLSILVQNRFYTPQTTISTILLALGLILAGGAFIFISSTRLRWKRIYHGFSIPITLYIVVIAYYILSSSRPVLAPLWPLLGFLVLGLVGFRGEVGSRLQIKLNIDE